MKERGRWLISRLLVIGVLVAMATVQMGCCKGVADYDLKLVRKPYPVPTKTVSLEQIVGEYNANASGVPKLKAQAKISLTLADSKGRTFTWDSAKGSPGTLLVGKESGEQGMPDFVLVGKQTSQEIFRIGVSAEEGLYYGWYHFGKEGQAWRGQLARLGSPQTAEFFIDPLGLVSVLGVVPLPDQSRRQATFAALPAVAMTMSRGELVDGTRVERTKPAYVLTVVDTQPGTQHAAFKRQIFFNWDDNTPRPFMVRFYSRDGRHLLTAMIDKYSEVPGKANGRPAMVASHITLVPETWPGRVNNLRRLELTLHDFVTDEGDPRAAAKYTDFLPPGLPEIDLDNPQSARQGELPLPTTTAPTEERR